MPAARISVRGVCNEPFHWTIDAEDGRWQTGAVVRGYYLADSEATGWAEWYRHTSELGVPPQHRMPRETWEIEVDVVDIADLTSAAVLAAHGITELRPTRRQWPLTQPVGGAYYGAGFRGLVAPSAAHEGGHVVAIFRPFPALPGLSPKPPAHLYAELPPLPPGLRT